MTKKNGKYVPFNDLPAYNRQRQRGVQRLDLGGFAVQ
jgi:hypothetical protein